MFDADKFSRLLPIPLFRLKRKIAYLRKNQRGIQRCSNIIASRRALHYLARHFDENIPPYINVEITTECNYRCPFCPQSSFGRKAKYITTDAFRYLIEELKKIKFNRAIMLYVNNEPFLHPQLMEFCRIISKELPLVQIIIESNGALITEDHIRSMSLLSNPIVLKINDYAPEHAIAMKIKTWFEKLEYKNSMGLRINLRSWQEKLSNRAGNQPGCASYLDAYQDIICTWPFSALFLDTDLRSFLCCSDYKHTIIMGDLRKETIMQVWKGEKYREVRRKMLISGRRENGLCQKCDAEWFG